VGVERAGQRSWLSLSEAAVVLELRVRCVRNMVRRHELVDVRCGRLRGIDVEALRARVADRPLAGAVLDAIAGGRLRVARRGCNEDPVSLMESWDAIQ
jgi:hypothetical protein